MAERRQLFAEMRKCCGIFVFWQMDVSLQKTNKTECNFRKYYMDLCPWLLSAFSSKQGLKSAFSVRHVARKYT